MNPILSCQCSTIDVRSIHHRCLPTNNFIPVWMVFLVWRRLNHWNGGKIPGCHQTEQQWWLFWGRSGLLKPIWLNEKTTGRAFCCFGACWQHHVCLNWAVRILQAHLTTGRAVFQRFWKQPLYVNVWLLSDNDRLMKNGMPAAGVWELQTLETLYLE